MHTRKQRLGDAVAMVNVIFFDAVGTLFRVRDSVGHIYSRIARDYGVALEPEAVNQSFYQAFVQSPPAAFPGVSAADLYRCEQSWWRDVVERTFTALHHLDSFSDFSAYFRDVFQIFATPAAWELYDETLSVLETLHQQQFHLGAISNFDSRLFAVLRGLELDEFFDTVTVSTSVGAAKPDAKVFAFALQQAGIADAATALHIGDSARQDYLGAKGAGLQALWLHRHRPAIAERDRHLPAADTITDLRGIFDRLKLRSDVR